MRLSWVSDCFWVLQHRCLATVHLLTEKQIATQAKRALMAFISIRSNWHVWIGLATVLCMTPLARWSLWPVSAPVLCCIPRSIVPPSSCGPSQSPPTGWRHSRAATAAGRWVRGGKKTKESFIFIPRKSFSLQNSSWGIGYVFAKILHDDWHEGEN